MSTADVVAKDILDVRRAKIVWFVGGLFTFITALFIYWGRDAPAVGEWSPVYLALTNLVFVGAMFVPAIALVGAYLAIAGERESGSIKYLLSTPIRRRDVVLGKYASRAAVVAASLAVAFVIATGLTLAWYDDFPAGVFAGVAVLTALYALAYVAVAIAISAATASRSRAMGGALGFYFITNLLVIFGQLSILRGIEWVLNELLGLGVGEDPIQFLGMLISPTFSYFASTLLVFPTEFMQASPEFGEPADAPWYLQGEVGLVLLLAWIVVPLAFGIWRFERADLG